MNGNLRENRAGFETERSMTQEAKDVLLKIDNIRGVHVQSLNSHGLQNTMLVLNSQSHSQEQFERINIFDFNSPTIPRNIELHFQSLHGTNTIIHGRDIEKEGEILISERIFKEYNIPNPELFINNYITIQGCMTNFFADGVPKTEFVILEPKKIVGILDERLDEIWFFNRFIIKQDITQEEMVWVEVCFESFEGIESTLLSIYEMFPEAIKGWYMGTHIIEDMRFIERVQSFVQSFLLMLIIVIVIMFLASTIFNQYFLLKKNKSFYGILKAKGLTNVRLSMMYFFELFFILLISGITGFGLSFALIAVLNIPFNIFLGFQFVFTFLNVITVFLSMFILAIVFATLITTVIYFFILKKDTVYLLRCNN